jgi:hypothetical protein
MNKDKEEQQRSSYEIQLVMNEKCYKGHFDSIKNLKRLLIETQKLHDQNEDTRVKQKCITILKTAKKQLKELENKTPEVTRNYLINKRKLESLR